MKSAFAFFSILRAPRRAFESPQAGAPTFRGCQNPTKAAIWPLVWPSSGGCRFRPLLRRGQVASRAGLRSSISRRSSGKPHIDVGSVRGAGLSRRHASHRTFREDSASALPRARVGAQRSGLGPWRDSACVSAIDPRRRRKRRGPCRPRRAKRSANRPTPCSGCESARRLTRDRRRGPVAMTAALCCQPSDRSRP